MHTLALVLFPVTTIIIRTISTAIKTENYGAREQPQRQKLSLCKEKRADARYRRPQPPPPRPPDTPPKQSRRSVSRCQLHTNPKTTRALKAANAPAEKGDPPATVRRSPQSVHRKKSRNRVAPKPRNPQTREPQKADKQKRRTLTNKHPATQTARPPRSTNQRPPRRNREPRTIGRLRPQPHSKANGTRAGPHQIQVPGHDATPRRIRPMERPIHPAPHRPDPPRHRATARDPKPAKPGPGPTRPTDAP